MRPGPAGLAVVAFWSAVSLVPLVNACGDSVQAKPDGGRGGSSGGAGGSGGSGTGGTWPPPCPYPFPCPACGDRMLDHGEACDDGNTVFGDGCNGLCQIETNWNCSGPECYRLGRCGDGWFDEGEACDDGNQQDGDGCSAKCLRVETGWYCPAQGMPCKPIGTPAGSVDGGIGQGAICGNGVVEGGEACDDGLDYAAGATNDGHYGGCTAACQLAPRCGDGIVNGPEACDLAKWNGVDDGPGSCTAGCMHHYCGDGFADGDWGEECDLGDLNGQPDQGCDRACKNVFTPKPCVRCL